MPDKRKFEGDGSEGKTKKTHWQQDPSNQLSPFSVGIFMTCVRGKEVVATKDALEMLNDYAERHQIAQASLVNADEKDEEEDEVGGIEAAIASELGSLKAKKQPEKTQLFTALKTLTECVIFIRTAKGINPVEIVHEICAEARSNPRKKLGGRFIKRMTPISVSADASVTGLQSCLDRLLPGIFADKSLKYKIEPTFRNHNVLNRDLVIPEVATAISQTGAHTVDLKNYDVLVMVETLRHFIGISVVRDWELFRKYNLSEIYTDALPKKERSRTETEHAAKT